MPGYSGTPLPKKLGIKPDDVIVIIDAPPNYAALLAPLPERVTFKSEATRGTMFLHLFVSQRAVLERELKRLRRMIADTGILWISWPKKSSWVART